MSGHFVIEMQDLSGHNLLKHTDTPLHSARGKSNERCHAWQPITGTKGPPTTRGVKTAVTVITSHKPNRSSNRRATRSNRTRSNRTRSNRTRSSNETKRAETDAETKKNAVRKQRTALLITKSTWTGRTRLSPITEFHNTSPSNARGTLSEQETKRPETTAMQSNWTRSPNTRVTTSKRSRLARRSQVVEFNLQHQRPAPITSTTRDQRQKSKQQTECFLENQLLHQLNQLFGKICDEHMQSRGNDADLVVLRRHVRKVESQLADIRDLKPDLENFEQKLASQCQAFVDLNSRAIAACIEFRSRSR